MPNYKYDLQALISQLEAQGELEPFLSDLFSFEMARSRNRGIEDVLFDPQVKTDGRLAYAESIFGSLLGPSFMQFLKRLIENDDAHHFDSLAAELLELVQRIDRLSFAEVTSAVPLGSEQIARIRDHLSRITKEDVFVYNVLSGRLLGGFTVKLKGRILDLSVRRDLEALKGELVQGQQAR